MPELDKEILVKYWDGVTIATLHLNPAPIGEYGSYNWYAKSSGCGCCDSGPEFEEVTHWIEIPALPKEIK